MPKYDYRCPLCKEVEEFEHGMMEDPRFECKRCVCYMQKIVTAPAGTHFKGQGWGKLYRVHKPKDQ